MAAAKRATDAFSHADAAKLYRRAIEAARADAGAADPSTVAQAWEQLGEALRSVGEPRAATEALTQARRILRDDPIAQARLFHRHAAVAVGSEALSAAVRWVNRGFVCLDPLATSEAIVWRARLRSDLGGVRNRQGKWREAIAACRQAIAEAESVHELPALAKACYALDWALVESGRLDEANYSWRALEIYQQLGDLEQESKVLNNLGGFAYFDGRWDDAVELYRRAGSASERAGQPLAAAYADGNVGEILSDQGHLDEAEKYLQRASRVLSAVGDRGAVAFNDGLLGRLYVRRGEYQRGLAALTSALENIRELRVDAYAGYAEALIAEAHAFGGDPFDASRSPAVPFRPTTGNARCSAAWARSPWRAPVRRTPRCVSSVTHFASRVSRAQSTRSRRRSTSSTRSRTPIGSCSPSAIGSSSA